MDSKFSSSCQASTGTNNDRRISSYYFNRSSFTRSVCFGTAAWESGGRRMKECGWGRIDAAWSCKAREDERGARGEGGKREVEEPSRDSGEMSEVSLSRDTFDSYVKSGSPQLKVAPLTLEEAQRRTNTLHATYELLSHFTQQNTAVLHSIVCTIMQPGPGFVNMCPSIQKHFFCTIHLIQMIPNNNNQKGNMLRLHLF